MQSIQVLKSLILVMAGLLLGVVVTVAVLAMYSRTSDQPPQLSEEYLDAENSVIAALAEALGGHLGTGNPVVQRHVGNVHIYQRLYHFDSAPPGEYAHDTEDFYPWLRDHMLIQAIRGSGRTDDVRSELDARFSHGEFQIRSAIYEPESGIGVAFREMERSERSQHGTGSQIYWDWLIEPYLQGIWNWAPTAQGTRVLPTIRLEQSLFANVQFSYETERRQELIPNDMYFGDYLAESEYLPNIMR